MIYKFNANFIDKIKIFLENKWYDYTHKVWNRKLHRIVCHFCGDSLKSQVKYSYSPEECGWEKVKNIYICHRCLCHRDFKPYIKQIDEDERKRWEKTRVIM